MNYTKVGTDYFYKEDTDKEPILYSNLKAISNAYNPFDFEEYLLPYTDTKNLIETFAYNNSDIISILNSKINEYDNHLAVSVAKLYIALLYKSDVARRYSSEHLYIVTLLLGDINKLLKFLQSGYEDYKKIYSDISNYIVDEMHFNRVRQFILNGQYNDGVLEYIIPLANKSVIKLYGLSNSNNIIYDILYKDYIDTDIKAFTKSKAKSVLLQKAIDYKQVPGRVENKSDILSIISNNYSHWDIVNILENNKIMLADSIKLKSEKLLVDNNDMLKYNLEIIDNFSYVLDSFNEYDLPADTDRLSEFYKYIQDTFFLKDNAELLKLSPVVSSQLETAQTIVAYNISELPLEDNKDEYTDLQKDIYYALNILDSSIDIDEIVATKNNSKIIGSILLSIIQLQLNQIQEKKLTHRLKGNLETIDELINVLDQTDNVEGQDFIISQLSELYDEVDSQIKQYSVLSASDSSIMDYLQTHSKDINNLEVTSDIDTLEQMTRKFNSLSERLNSITDLLNGGGQFSLTLNADLGTLNVNKLLGLDKLQEMFDKLSGAISAKIGKLFDKIGAIAGALNSMLCALKALMCLAMAIISFMKDTYESLKASYDYLSDDFYEGTPMEMEQSAKEEAKDITTKNIQDEIEENKIVNENKGVLDIPAKKAAKKIEDKYYSDCNEECYDSFEGCFPEEECSFDVNYSEFMLAASNAIKGIVTEAAEEYKKDLEQKLDSFLDNVIDEMSLYLSDILKAMNPNNCPKSNFGVDTLVDVSFNIEFDIPTFNLDLPSLTLPKLNC